MAVKKAASKIVSMKNRQVGNQAWWDEFRKQFPDPNAYAAILDAESAIVKGSVSHTTSGRDVMNCPAPSPAHLAKAEPPAVAALVQNILCISFERAEQASLLEGHLLHGLPMNPSKDGCAMESHATEHGPLKDMLLTILSNLATIERSLEAIATYTVA